MQYFYDVKNWYIKIGLQLRKEKKKKKKEEEGLLDLVEKDYECINYSQ